MDKPLSKRFTTPGPTCKRPSSSDVLLLKRFAPLPSTITKSAVQRLLVTVHNTRAENVPKVGEGLSLS